MSNKQIVCWIYDYLSYSYYLSPVIVSEVHDLLRGAGALGRFSGECEHCQPAREVLHATPALLAVLWRIDSRHRSRRVVESVFETEDLDWERIVIYICSH